MLSARATATGARSMAGSPSMRQPISTCWTPTPVWWFDTSSSAMGSSGTCWRGLLKISAAPLAPTLTVRRGGGTGTSSLSREPSAGYRRRSSSTGGHPTCALHGDRHVRRRSLRRQRSETRVMQAPRLEYGRLMHRVRGLASIVLTYLVPQLHLRHAELHWL